MSLPAYWQHRARPEGVPTLLLHGFLGAGDEWHAIMDGLFDADCLAPDLPGHGLNPQADCSFEAAAAQIWADLGAAGYDPDARPLRLVGYSMGARLGLYLLLSWPARFRSAVLESGSPGLSDEGERKARRRLDEALARRLEHESLTDFLAHWYAQPLFAPLRTSPAFAGMLARRGRNEAAGLARSLRAAGPGTAPALWQRLGELSRPLLYLCGERDEKFCRIGAEMAERSPLIEVLRLPGGHCPHLEAPQPWLWSVKRFWDEGPGR